jgi:glycosyltransferase involved in cell wall biosynthesis
VRQSWSHLDVLASTALAAQRLNIRPPRIVVSAARRLLRRIGDAGGAGIEDWSTPLVARGTATQVFDAPPALEPAAPRPAPRVEPVRCGLRCLIVTSDLDAGGMDEVVAFLARRLPQHGIRTAVLHASDRGGTDGAPSGRLGRALRAEGVEVVELASPCGADWLAAWRPEVISAHGAPGWVLDAANRLSIPYVETLHGMHSLFNADWIAEAERSRRLARIVAVSDLVRRQYLEGNPMLPGNRIVTIPNGVDGERRAPPDRALARALLGLRDEFLFVSLARHCLQKNTYGLVSAFGDLAPTHSTAHLVIAGRPGDPMYFSQVAKLRDGLTCRERIHLRDHTPDPAALLAAADGFVLDSFFEGWSLASMEALHAGVPVVLSEVGGAREQVGDDGVRGVIVPNPLGDPSRVDWQTIRQMRFEHQVNRKELVAAMSSLIRNRKAWADSRQRLIADAAGRFSAWACLDAHAKLLRDAAAAVQPKVAR